eukprot:6063215-Prymnesium_polylepis.1
MYAKAEARLEAANEENEAATAAQEYMLHGMGREELEAVMKEVFAKADVDGSGALSLNEFHKCINEAELGLSAYRAPTPHCARPVSYTHLRAHETLMNL